MTTVFAPWAVAAEPYYSVKLSYLTNVIPVEDGTEQRIMLRIVPVREHAYLARTIQAKNTGWLDALTYGNQSGQMAIPHWPHGTFLTASAAAGSSVTLNVADTTDRDFVANGYAVVWADDGHAEEVTITSKTGTTVVAATLGQSYGRGAFVIPSYRGKITGDLDLSRFHASMADVPVTLTMEHQADPGVASPTSALIFSTVPYMRVDVSHQLARQVARVESETYTYADYPTRVAPIGTRPFRVWVNSRSAANALIAWFESVKGRFKSFYLPTYQDDLKVTAGLGTTSLTIQRCGYTSSMFANPERKVLAAVQPSGTVTKCTVISAVDNGIATGTETLTLDVAAPSSTTLLSYLLYGRLESDTLELRWQNNTRAECLMGFVECPAELAPTEFEQISDSADLSGAPNLPAGPAVAGQSTAVVPNGQDEVATFITVTARDANSIRVTTGGATVAGTVTGANAASLTVTDLDNGQYRAQYTPHNTGTDSIAITYNASPIKNSPFTSVVATTPVTPPVAVRFGFWHVHPFSYGPDTFWETTSGVSGLVASLAGAQTAGVQVAIKHSRNKVIDGAGRFSVSAFQTATDEVAALSLASYISNGTLKMHIILDDVYAGKFGGQAPSIAQLSAACAYSKSVWPTVKTAIRTTATSLLGVTNLDYAICQYSARKGDATSYRAANERASTSIGCRLCFGLNVLDGGDGTSGMAGYTAGKFTMSGAEIVKYGKILAASPRNDYFLCWKYVAAESLDASYFAQSSIHTAVQSLAAFCAGEAR